MGSAARRLRRGQGIDLARIRVSYGKVAEMQRRGVVHFHAIIRLDGVDPDNPDAVVPVRVLSDREITDGMVAGYLATKSTETAGHLSGRATAPRPGHCPPRPCGHHPQDLRPTPTWTPCERR